MKKQTAVEFAVEKLEKLIPSGNQLVIGAILEEAKKMEKEQINNAYSHGANDRLHNRIQNYYNETYKK